FLSQLIQNVMGYSPLQAGVAFLPFPFAMVFGAALSSKLVAKVDPRILAGTGTAFAGVSLFFFHRITVNDSAQNIFTLIGKQAANPAHPVHLGDTINYWTSIFPFIALMAFGMALVFIPMTLSAVHGVEDHDSGIGSGVLNTMQQLGGALGLAVLATVAFGSIGGYASDLVAKVQHLAPTGGHPSAAVQAASHQMIYQAGFTHGSTMAFLVGAFMIWAASVIVWMFLNVSHEELQADGVPEGLAVA
ncbi:MAG: MFS transporter, partial [Marmoricola sp.]